MWLGLVSLFLSSHCLLMARCLWQFLCHSFWNDRHSVACSCLPHSWRRLIAFSLSPTVGFCGHCLHVAGCLDSFSAVCWVGGLYGLALSPSSLTFPILPLGSGRIQTVSVVCLPVLPCHMLGSSRWCPGCLLLAFGACLLSVTLVAKSGFPSIPFLAHSLLHLALTLRQAWALLPPSVRSGLPVSITIPGGCFIMEAFMLKP